MPRRAPFFIQHFYFNLFRYTIKYKFLYVILFVHFYIKKYNSVPFYFMCIKNLIKWNMKKYKIKRYTIVFFNVKMNK